MFNWDLIKILMIPVVGIAGLVGSYYAFSIGSELFGWLLLAIGIVPLSFVAFMYFSLRNFKM